LIILFRSYEKKKLKTPQVIEGKNYIKCILPRQKLLSTEINEQERILTLFDTVSRITTSDVAQAFNISRPTAKRWLQILIKEDRIKQVGRGRAAHYVLLFRK